MGNMGDHGDKVDYKPRNPFSVGCTFKLLTHMMLHENRFEKKYETCVRDLPTKKWPMGSVACLGDSTSADNNVTTCFSCVRKSRFWGATKHLNPQRNF